MFVEKNRIPTVASLSVAVCCPFIHTTLFTAFDGDDDDDDVLWPQKLCPTTEHI